MQMTPTMQIDRRTTSARTLGLATSVVLISCALSGCIMFGGGGPSQEDAVDWARTTSGEILEAVDIDSPPLSATEREGVCTAIGYATEKWNSWVITTTLPIEAADRIPLLARVTDAFDRAGWTVLGDDPGEVEPMSEEEFWRSLSFDASVDDQGANVTVSPSSTAVEITVRSACYVTSGDDVGS